MAAVVEGDRYAEYSSHRSTSISRGWPAAFDMAAIDKGALVEACEDHGFFLLVNHGCDAQVHDVFAAAADFLPCRERKKLPCTEMRKIHWVITTVNSPSSAAIRKKSSTSRQATTFPVAPKAYALAKTARSFPARAYEFFTAFTGLAETTMRLVLSGLPSCRRG